MGVQQRVSIAPLEEGVDEDAGRLVFSYNTLYPEKVWLRVDVSGEAFVAHEYSGDEFASLAREFLHLRLDK